MKKTFFLFAVLAVLMTSFCGCSDPAVEKEKSNAALRAEVTEILDSIHVVEKGILSTADRADIVNGDILMIYEKYKRLCELTGLKFYSWVLTAPNTPFYSEEHFKKLTERTPKLIPFCVEDDMSGTLYFAPPQEQEFIINKYKDWFAKNGGTFDFDAVQKERNIKE